MNKIYLPNSTSLGPVLVSLKFLIMGPKFYITLPILMLGLSPLYEIPTWLGDKIKGLPVILIIAGNFLGSKPSI